MWSASNRPRCLDATASTQPRRSLDGGLDAASTPRRQGSGFWGLTVSCLLTLTGSLARAAGGRSTSCGKETWRFGAAGGRGAGGVVRGTTARWALGRLYGRHRSMPRGGEARGGGLTLLVICDTHTWTGRACGEGRGADGPTSRIDGWRGVGCQMAWVICRTTRDVLFSAGCLATRDAERV